MRGEISKSEGSKLPNKTFIRVMNEGSRYMYWRRIEFSAKKIKVDRRISQESKTGDRIDTKWKGKRLDSKSMVGFSPAIFCSFPELD